MMEEAVAELRADFAEQRIPVEVLHGAEIDLGLLWAIPPTELRRLTIAQTGRYLLLEFPYRRWPLALDTSVSGWSGSASRPYSRIPSEIPRCRTAPTASRSSSRSARSSRSRPARLREGETGPRRPPRYVCSSSAWCTCSPATRTGRTSAARGWPRSPRLGDAALARYLTVDVPTAVVAGEARAERPQVRLAA